MLNCVFQRILSCISGLHFNTNRPMVRSQIREIIFINPNQINFKKATHSNFQGVKEMHEAISCWLCLLVFFSWYFTIVSNWPLASEVFHPGNIDANTFQNHQKTKLQGLCLPKGFFFNKLYLFISYPISEHLLSKT